PGVRTEGPEVASGTPEGAPTGARYNVVLPPRRGHGTRHEEAHRHPRIHPSFRPATGLSPQRDPSGPVARRSTSPTSSTAAPPRRLARYIASSAASMSAAPLPGPSAMTTPMLADKRASPEPCWIGRPR